MRILLLCMVLFAIISCPVKAELLSFNEETLTDGIRNSLNMDQNAWITEEFDNVEDEKLYIVGKHVQTDRFLETVRVRTYSGLIYGFGETPLLGAQSDIDVRIGDQDFQAKITTSPNSGGSFMLFTFSHKF